MRKIEFILLFIFTFGFIFTSFSQNKDSLEKNIILKYKDFKPNIKTTPKIYFDLPLPINDSIAMKFKYDFLKPNFWLPYETVYIKPLELNIDSILPTYRNNFVQINYGTFSNFNIQGLYSLGELEHKNGLLNIHYNTYQGDLPFQSFQQFLLDFWGFKYENDFKQTLDFRFNTTTQYKYGIQNSNSIKNKDDIINGYNVIQAKYTLSNNTANDYYFNFYPTIQLTYFNDGRLQSKNETIIDFKIPLSKSLNNHITYFINSGLNYQIFNNSPQTYYYNKSALFLSPYNISNAISYIEPGIEFLFSKININIRLNSSFYNSEYYFLPDLQLKVKFPKTNLNFIVGLASNFIYNSFYDLHAQNNWIGDITQITPIRHSYGYIGFLTSLNHNIGLSSKVSLNNYYNQPLFLNNNYLGETFNVLYETQLTTLKLDFDLTFRIQDNLHFNSNLVFEDFYKQEKYAQPFGLIPLKIHSNLNWKVNQKIILDVILNFMEGTIYGQNSNRDFKQNAGLFLNFEGKYSLKKHWQFLLKLNNIFNSIYQRWNQYSSLGFAANAGIIYNFNNPKK